MNVQACATAQLTGLGVKMSSPLPSLKLCPMSGLSPSHLYLAVISVWLGEQIGLGCIVPAVESQLVLAG